MKVPKIFSDYAVFQRNKPIRIWGEGEGVVFASLNGHTAYTVCREGQWKLFLPAMDAGGPYDLILKDAREEVVISGILIGDVWIAAGQSNMEHITILTYDGIEDAKALGDNPNIRLFTVPRKTRASDKEPDWHFETVSPIDTPWKICTSEEALHFSAIGFRFASYLQRDENIPIGIISANCGGTPAESWIDEGDFFSNTGFEELQFKYYNILEELDINEYTQMIDDFQKNRGARIKNVSIEKALEEMGLDGLARKNPFEYIPEPEPAGPYQNRWPGVLFKYMIKPIMPYSVCGVLWYQGESNVNNRQYYFKLFSMLVDCWRKGFGDDLPFLTVQIAPFGYAIPEGCTQLVSQQIKAAKEMKGVYLVTSNDIGERDNIHPLNKKVISERLYLAAKSVVYGDDVEYSGPIFEKAVLDKDNMVRVSFEHIGSGLYIDGEIDNLYLKGESGKYEPAKSKIVGNELVVWSSKVVFPKEIKMAFDNTDVIKLYNKEGFVAAPFYSKIDRNIP